MLASARVPNRGCYSDAWRSMLHENTVCYLAQQSTAYYRIVVSTTVRYCAHLLQKLLRNSKQRTALRRTGSKGRGLLVPGEILSQIQGCTRVSRVKICISCVFRLLGKSAVYNDCTTEESGAGKRDCREYSLELPTFSEQCTRVQYAVHTVLQ